MGHILSSNGLFPEPEKVDSTLNMKPPSNTSEVRSFLGVVTYCGKFIPNFATITGTLRQLTRQKADFVWNGEQESAFSKVKTFISKAPVLLYFHPAFETKIVADASKQGLGAVLLQKNRENSVFQPVAFASRSLSKFREIREVTQNDEILTKVCDAINNNRWRFYKNDIHMKPYYVLRKELIFHEGVSLRKQKLVIPNSLCRSVL